MSAPESVSDVALPLTEQEQEQVRQALETLLQSGPLRTSAQCQQLLRYIVEHTLTGDLGVLRERVIGREVFGRRPDYEPSGDPVVRIRAADLRKRLALYYQGASNDQLPKIDVPSGSYRATFTWPAEQTSLQRTNLPAQVGPVEQNPPTPLVVGEPSLPLPPKKESAAALLRSRKSHLRPALAFILLVAAVIGGYGYYTWWSDPVRQFWAPMLASPKPVLISVGSNAVYRIGDREMDSYLAQQGEAMQAMNGVEIYPPLRPDQTLKSTGIKAAPDSFVALGDVAAVSEIVRTLTHYGKEFEERFPTDISFGEVHEHPSVLIGGANNPMTKDLTRDLPFVREGRNWIADVHHPGKGWELKTSGDLHDTNDYAIITRLVGKDDASPMVSVAGLGAHGTLAASEFLCRPQSFRELNRKLGSGWKSRNFQVILRIRVIDFKPTDMDVVGWQIW